MNTIEEIKTFIESVRLKIEEMDKEIMNDILRTTLSWQGGK